MERYPAQNKNKYESKGLTPGDIVKGLGAVVMLAGVTVGVVRTATPYVQEALGKEKPPVESTAHLNKEQRHMLDETAAWSAQRLLDPANQHASDVKVTVGKDKMTIEGGERFMKKKAPHSNKDHAYKTAGESEFSITFDSAPKDNKWASIQTFLNKSPHLDHMEVTHTNKSSIASFETSVDIHPDKSLGGMAVTVTQPEQNVWSSGTVDGEAYGELGVIEQANIIELGLREASYSDSDGYISNIQEANKRYGEAS